MFFVKVSHQSPPLAEPQKVSSKSSSKAAPKFRPHWTRLRHMARYSWLSWHGEKWWHVDFMGFSWLNRLNMGIPSKKQLQTIQHARVLKGIVILNNDEIRLMCRWEKNEGLVWYIYCRCPCVGPSKFFWCQQVGKWKLIIKNGNQALQWTFRCI